jgi:CDP-glucose 4,6-dehydratase
VEDLVSAPAGFADAYRARRVLVTGHTGFKGSWLCAWLGRLGAEVTGFSDGVPTEPSHFARLALPVRDLRGDIGDEAAVRAAIREARPEIVFHLAAQSLVRRAYRDPVGTYRTNVLGSLTLFEACRAEGGVAAIVSATTDKVYRNREWEWGYREEDELGGSDPYSASKSCVELMTRSWADSFLRGGELLIASVRAGNVIGGGDWAEDRLIPDIVRAGFRGESVVVRNPGSARPWQHVLDPLSGYLTAGVRLLAGDAAAATAWNFGPMAKASISVQDILTMMKTYLPQLQVEYRPDSGGAHESGLLQLDSSKALARLGWRPRWEREMLERTIEWYKAFYERGELLTDAQIQSYMAAAGEGA